MRVAAIHSRGFRNLVGRVPLSGDLAVLVVSYTAIGATDLSELDGPGRWEFRQATMELLRGVPDLADDLRAWIRGAATVLGEVVASVVDSPAHKPGQMLTSQAAQEGHIAGEVLVPVARQLRAQTGARHQGRDSRSCAGCRRLAAIQAAGCEEHGVEPAAAEGDGGRRGRRGAANRARGPDQTPAQLRARAAE